MEVFEEARKKFQNIKIYFEITSDFNFRISLTKWVEKNSEK